MNVAGCTVIALVLPAVALLAQTPLEQAADAYLTAQAAEIELKANPPPDRTRSKYLSVIRMYERVYLITPHTGYADDALFNIAALYELIDDSRNAVRTLQFLAREYPASRFVSQAESDLERLTAPPATDAAIETADDNGNRPSAGPVRPDRSVAVENIRYWESQKSVRVVVDLAGEPTFTQGDAQNPPRVFVDIHGARVGSSLGQRSFPVESVMLRNVRVGQNDVDTVRVVLDLVQFHTATVFSLRDPYRLVIDVLGDAPALTGTIGQTAATELNPPAPATEHEDTASTPAVTETSRQPAPTATEESLETARNEGSIGTPASPDANGEYSRIRSLGLKVGRVVIDPGHGGNDTGTIGPSGLTEKELVLDLALDLKERIESGIGAEVVLTRHDDSFVPLEARTAMANQAEADLFLSIHANSSRSEAIRGFETYILNMATNNADREIAARENAASQAAISELQDLVSQILLQEKVDESRELATHIQKAMAEREDFGTDRGVKQAPFVVLIGANMPSILAEVSFISNPQDERLLKGDDRRHEIVEALFDGVRSYSQTLSSFGITQIQD